MALEAINPNLEALEVDHLYHFGLDTNMDLKGMFGDVKYVCMGGSPERAKAFAEKAARELGIKVPWRGIRPIGKTERFSLYKIGPIISVSHGMGMPSMSICLHEITKLLHYADAQDFKYIRIGTSGGLGVDPGTVVVTKRGVNGKLEPKFESTVLGGNREWATDLDGNLAKAILAVKGAIKVVYGDTMGTHNFYDGQGRVDGALDPEYTEDEKNEFLKRAYDLGVRNIEMESTEFAAFCLRAGIPAAIVCVAILNRLDGDQVTSTPEQLAQFSGNAQELVLRYIRKELGFDIDAPSPADLSLPERLSRRFRRFVSKVMGG